MPSKVKFLSLFIILLSLVALLSAESKGWQFVQSLTVPGLSQVRSGRNYGYAMLASEAGIISTILYLGAERNLKAQEYYEYALKFAHIQPRDYPEQYFKHLSRFDSSGFEAGGYNAFVRQEAMRLFPNDPIEQQLYIDENIYPDEYAWNWDSQEDRGTYSGIRIKAQDLRDYGSMALGVMIVNHLISGIDVLRYFSESKRSQVYLDIKDQSPMLIFSVQW